MSLFFFFVFFFIHLTYHQPILDELSLEIATQNNENELESVNQNVNKKQKIKIAKIDATKNKKIAAEYSVKTFPTIKYVKNGILSDYTGIRTKVHFVSFLEIISGNVISYIKNENDVRTLQLKNVLSDTGNSNILFLLTIYTAKNDDSNIKNIQKEVENTFITIATKYQGKAIFAIYYENIKKFRETGNNHENTVLPQYSEYFTISKQEINRPNIFFKNFKDTQNSDNDNNNNNNVNIIIPQILEAFIISNNRPIISKLSQHNFKDLSSLNKIMVIAVVKNVTEIESKNFLQTDNDYNSDNNDNNNDKKFDVNENRNEINDQKNRKNLVSYITKDSDGLLNSLKYSIEKFEKTDPNKLDKKLGNKNENNLELNDFIFGYLDSVKWKRFLKQFKTKAPAILILNFKNSVMTYYIESLQNNNVENMEGNSINYSENDNESNENNQIDNSNFNEQTFKILNNLIENKIKFQKTKSTTEKIIDYFLNLKNKFRAYYPYSAIFLSFIFIFIFSFFFHSPSISVKIKKN